MSQLWARFLVRTGSQSHEAPFSRSRWVARGVAGCPTTEPTHTPTTDLIGSDLQESHHERIVWESFTCTALRPWPGDDEAVIVDGGLGYRVWTRSPGASLRINLSARRPAARLLKEHSRTLADRTGIQ